MEQICTVAFDRMVLQSAEGLPFDLARALWLVDVCGLSYAAAAAETGITRCEVAQLVQRARRRVRAQLLTGPSAT